MLITFVGDVAQCTPKMPLFCWSSLKTGAFVRMRWRSIRRFLARASVVLFEDPSPVSIADAFHDREGAMVDVGVLTNLNFH